MKREVLLSCAGHLVLLALVGLVGGLRARKQQPRPLVYTVRLELPTGPESSAKSEGTALVQSKPKAELKPEPKLQPGPKSGPGTVRKHGIGARIEGADALGYAYYLNIILARIADNWVNPCAGQPTPYNATVFFVVERDGTLRGVKLEKGSGNQGYDGSCERALLVTEKLPPLPPEFTGRELRLHLEFEYKQ